MSHHCLEEAENYSGQFHSGWSRLKGHSRPNRAGVPIKQTPFVKSMKSKQPRPSDRLVTQCRRPEEGDVWPGQAASQPLDDDLQPSSHLCPCNYPSDKLWSSTKNGLSCSCWSSYHTHLAGEKFPQNLHLLLAIVRSRFVPYLSWGTWINLCYLLGRAKIIEINENPKNKCLSNRWTALKEHFMSRIKQGIKIEDWRHDQIKL